MTQIRAVEAELNREWEWRLATQGVDQWWDEPALAGFAGLEEVVAAATQVGEIGDAVLRTLLGRARAGDELAGRVVLQGLLPWLVGAAARERGAGQGDFVSAAWVAIRDHPPQAGHGVAFALLRRVTRLVRAERQPAIPLAVMPEPQPGPDGQPRGRDLIDAAERAGLVPRETCRWLRTVYADGLSGRDAATLHRTSPEALRQRCSWALRRLAEHRDELLAAV